MNDGFIEKVAAFRFILVLLTLGKEFTEAVGAKRDGFVTERG